MKLPALLFLFSFISSLTIQAAVTDIDCDKEQSFASLEQFSEEIFEAPFKKLPMFYQDWISKTLDKNKDLTIDTLEYKEVACRLSKNIYDITNKLRYEHPVYFDGQVSMYEYWAYDNKISSGAEFEVAMGKEARDWLYNYIWESGSVPLKYRLDIIKMITSGAYTVIEENIDQQVDLAGVDTSVESVYKKALKLIYTLDKLIVNDVSDELMSSYYKHASETKVFSYVKTIHSDALDTVIHSYSKSKVGPKGSYNFYVMENIDLKITKAGHQWGYPKDQKRFLLKDPKFMKINSYRFKKRIKNTLLTWTTLNEFEDLVEMYYESPISSSDELRSWAQTMLDQMSNMFWQDPIKVEIVESPMQGRTAYLEEQKIYVSSTNFFNLQSQISEENKDILLHHLMYVMIQEWVHYLQKSKTDLYAENFAFYNDAVNAYRIFGNEGTRWYKEQPIEKDAQDIAESFVLRHQNLLKK